MIPLAFNLVKREAFEGIWHQYAVYPDYLQEKCTEHFFHDYQYWMHFAQTDFENILVQYYCYEFKTYLMGRQHMKSISIFVRDRDLSQKTLNIVSNAIKRNFKFPMRLLNYTDTSFCTELELKIAEVRA
ncbi:uncharacterized protein LOC115626186 [Scaptodrosophila lebanonensis]|uniref:Uncharacterized protein LOC115626186 n=1 Tax=Drosophila lebanonensis TaxID=7225 RepID=A0A6J2TMS1_DROLE|nr:uncharacterized protein LOC115626186 [Scaptodrosophila lebanonensis]